MDRTHSQSLFLLIALLIFPTLGFAGEGALFGLSNVVSKSWVSKPAAPKKPASQRPSEAHYWKLRFVGPRALHPVFRKIVRSQALTQDEFLAYLRGLEARPLNVRRRAAAAARAPKGRLSMRSWARIATRLHDSQYGFAGGPANDRNTRFREIGPLKSLPNSGPLGKLGDERLFRNGSENYGFEKVSLFHRWMPLKERPVVPTEDKGSIFVETSFHRPELSEFRTTSTRLSPKWMLDDQGRKVDIGHSYAAVAALVMRDRFDGTLMSHVNTGWGDNWQVVSARFEAVKQGFFSSGGLNPWSAMNPVTQGYNPEKEFQTLVDRWKKAGKFKPEEQQLGNRLGNMVRRYLQKNRSALLSTAFQQVFLRIPEARRRAHLRRKWSRHNL